MTAEQRQEHRQAKSASAEQHQEKSGSGEACEDEGTCESDDGVVVSDADHLSDVPDGSGCTEIWEHLSEERDDDE